MAVASKKTTFSLSILCSAMSSAFKCLTKEQNPCWCLVIPHTRKEKEGNLKLLLLEKTLEVQTTESSTERSAHSLWESLWCRDYSEKHLNCTNISAWKVGAGFLSNEFWFKKKKKKSPESSDTVLQRSEKHITRTVSVRWILNIYGTDSLLELDVSHDIELEWDPVMSVILKRTLYLRRES